MTIHNYWCLERSLYGCILPRSELSRASFSGAFRELHLYEMTYVDYRYLLIRGDCCRTLSRVCIG